MAAVRSGAVAIDFEISSASVVACVVIALDYLLTRSGTLVCAAIGTVDFGSLHMPSPSLARLHNIATQLRIDSVRSTSEAGSGHPTTCLSSAEIMAALFFAEMRFDPKDPHHPESDRFVLSKGHAAPILYAAWAAAGAFPRSDLLNLRK